MFNFLMKKMLKAKMKDIPEEQQDKVLEAFSKNPQLFKQIAEEIKEKTKQGKDQMSAAMEVAAKYKDDLSKLM